jgi:predicted MFS family arabinose efflux permease
MTAADIGTSILLIAAAELIGEGLVVVASNRVAPQRMVCGALLTSVTAYIALGVIGQRVGLALAAVGAVFVAFEVVVVASIALVSTATLDRHDRTRLFGALMAATACGNAAGAAVAPVLFARGSIALSAAVSALAAAAAAVVLWFGVRSSSPTRR